ncbi:hypothetical protein ACQEVX_05305 [Streptomyces syringium]|uniref:hypothetical protein n=1 Tax=Streptomyces syringium TaxID=76729 RepID=UPI003D8A1065
MSDASTSAPAEAPFAYGFVLAKVLPAPEFKAITGAKFLDPHLLTAITLIAVGHSRQETADAMGISLTRLTSYFASAAKKLRCLPRMSLLVHRTYSHPACPSPNRLSTNPHLDANEWMVLLAHTGGITLNHLSAARMLSLDSLTRINRSLMDKLEAKTPAHAVRRAWQHGLLPGTSSASTEPTAGGTT